MPRRTPTHSCNGAQLRKTKAALEPFIFVADEAVVEIDVVGDEDPVGHELHKTVGNFREYPPSLADLEEWNAAVLLLAGTPGAFLHNRI
jgi:hypothetical protein